MSERRASRIAFAFAALPAPEAGPPWPVPLPHEPSLCAFLCTIESVPISAAVRFLFYLFRRPAAKRLALESEAERPCSQTFSPGRPAAARGRGSVGLAALRRWAARGAAGCMAARAAARRAAIAMPGSTVCTLPGSGRSPAMSARRAPRPWLGCCRGPGLRRKKQINAQTTLCTRKFRRLGSSPTRMLAMLAPILRSPPSQGRGGYQRPIAL